MAAVYGATHRNGSRAALKILHTEFARDEAVKQRFLREGYVANKVNHPGRVAILDDDETEAGEPYLVMELLEGETLQQLWKRKKRKVPVAEALGIAEQILDTLVPYHETRVIHRDLKPANIFITNEKVVKLLDFGVAQLREAGGEAMTRAGTALGTPSYMSPEQAMGKSDQLDGRSDVYSVGATLYAMLSGKRLHHGKSDNEAFILAATQPAPSLARSAPEIPTAAIALVDKALQWDRRSRFDNAAQMRDECTKVLAQLESRQPAPPGRSEKATVLPPRRKPKATLLGQPSPLAHRAGQPGIGQPSAGQPSAGQPTPGQRSPFGGQYTPGQQSPAHGNAQPPSVQPPSAHTPAILNPAAHTPASHHTPSPAHLQSAKPPPSAQWAADQHPTAPVPESRSDFEAQPQAAGQAQQEEQEPSKIVEVFERLERALPTIRQYGLEHPEATARIRAIFRAVVEALHEDPDCLFFTVHPFCFTQRNLTVWEPVKPNDSVPYNLCSAGVEEVRLMRGVTEEQLATLLHAMLLEPNDDNEDDIAAALWEARFTHIRCKVRDDMAEADAAEQERFFAEANDLEQMAREDLAEVAAMAVATDKSGWAAAKEASAALELPVAARRALGAQLSLEPERWQQRFFDAAAEAFADAEVRDDSPLVLAPLAKYVRELIQKGHYRALFATYQRLLERIAEMGQRPRPPSPTRLTAGLFSASTLRELLRVATTQELNPKERSEMLEGLRWVFSNVGPELLDESLSMANELPNGEVLELLMAYVDHVMVGREAVVVQRLDSLNPPLAQRMLAMVTASRTPQAISTLRPLLASPNPALRCEATALLSASVEELGKQLLKLMQSSDPRLRSAALTTMLRYNVRSAGPDLVRLVEAESFMKRPTAEQKQVFETLYALNAARAESLLISLLEQHGLMTDETIDRTRTLAAQVLGDRGHSERPLEALENAARRRPWNTQKLRIAAGAAAEAIGTRLASAVQTGQGEP